MLLFEVRPRQLTDHASNEFLVCKRIFIVYTLYSTIRTNVHSQIASFETVRNRIKCADLSLSHRVHIRSHL